MTGLGGFASLVLANLFPERVRSLVLVDGGLPLQVPEGLSDEEVISSVRGRGGRTPERHVPEPWRCTGPSGGGAPGFQRGLEPVIVDAYVEYDLTGERA